MRIAGFINGVGINIGYGLGKMALMVEIKALAIFDRGQYSGHFAGIKHCACSP
jgi:hypothetical protein